MLKSGYYNKVTLESRLFFCFVYFIILVKGLFVFFLLWNLYLKKKHGRSGDTGNETILEKKVAYYKNFTENIFIVSVSFLLIYLFNPYHNNMYLISKYVKILFFIYGILTLVMFDWNRFVTR